MVTFQLSNGCGKDIWQHGDSMIGDYVSACGAPHLCPVCDKNNELVNQVKEAIEKLKQRLEKRSFEGSTAGDEWDDGYYSGVDDMMEWARDDLDSCFEVKE